MAQAQDKVAIRDLIEEWVVTRDAALWDRFGQLWHEDGFMVATWFQGSASKFIDASRTGFKRGAKILHFLGGSLIDVSEERAVAQTKMQILQRGDVGGVEVDVTCQGRFHDLLEKREGSWGLVLRRLTYERDWLVPVNPGATVTIDAKVAERYPVGYRRLAYLQASLGFPVRDDLPGISGPGTERLYDMQRRWLAREPFDPSWEV